MSNLSPETVPPPTPTDKLLGWVILAVAVLGLVATGGAICLALRELAIPTVLELAIGQSITGLVALLAGRGRTV